MTRDEKIQAIADSMEGWDYAELTEWAKSQMILNYMDATDEEVDEGYQDGCVGYPEEESQ